MLKHTKWIWNLLIPIQVMDLFSDVTLHGTQDKLKLNLSKMSHLVMNNNLWLLLLNNQFLLQLKLINKHSNSIKLESTLLHVVLLLIMVLLLLVMVLKQVLVIG